MFLSSDINGLRVAMYPLNQAGLLMHPTVLGFDFLGHAVRRSVPGSLDLRDVIKLFTNGGCFYFGQRENGHWILLSEEPTTESLYATGIGLEYAHDVVR